MSFLLAGLAAVAAGGLFFVGFELAPKFVQSRGGRRERTRPLPNRLRSRFEAQLPVTLRLLAGSVRAGQSLPQALMTTASESAEPAKSLLQTVSGEVNLGKPVEEALSTLAARFQGHPCHTDLLLLSSAVSINRSTGGPLGELLDQLVETVQERRRLKEQVDALTAQGKMSGWIVGLLPVFLLIVLWAMDPDLVAPMFNTSTGLAMLSIGAVLEIIGALLIRRIVKVV